MHVEDDVLVVLFAADGGEGRVGSCSAVFLDAAQAPPQIARVGEREWLWDFDNQAAVEELQVARFAFGVFELVDGPWDAAEDLDAGPSRVADYPQEGQADADCDADFDVPKDCGDEDEGHEGKLGIAANADEEEDIRGRLFKERIGDDGYCSAENAFLDSQTSLIHGSWKVVVSKVTDRYIVEIRGHENDA